MTRIEKDFPLPEARLDYGITSTLAVGESVTFEKRYYPRVASAMRYRGQISGKTFVVRIVDGVVRVWRMK